MTDIVKMQESYMLPAYDILKQSIEDCWSYDAFMADFFKADTIYLASFISGELAGFIGALKTLDGLEILNLSVKPEFRKRGIASELIARLKDDFNDAECLYLEVRSKNTAALSLYEKCGFTALGVRKDYYKNPQDNAVIMRFCLNRG